MRPFSQVIRSRLSSDEINGFVITIPSSSIELPTWVVVCACTACVPFISLVLFGLFACLIVPFRGTPIPLSIFWITTALAVPIAALLGFREPDDGEVIQLVDDTLILAKKSGVWRRRREFDIARIRNLRLLPGTAPRIAFDYQGKTHQFGSDLGETEGLRVIKTLNDRYKVADDDEPLPVEVL